MHRDRELKPRPRIDPREVRRRRADDEDREFLEEVHIRALGPTALVGYGWTAERLRKQFHREIQIANCWVIEVRSSVVRAFERPIDAAGYVSIEQRDGHWYIDAIAIVPNFQRRGVGEAAMRDIMLEAGRIPVRLSVLFTNRARSLYRRLGFRVIGGDRQRELMEWRAQPF